jgi:catechol 2,3-dioxygenase-like lactoylglutathione lyase family enzyme
MTDTTFDSAHRSTPPAFAGYHHVAVTVRDIAASEAWYARALGLVRAFVEPHHGGTGYVVVMTRPGLPFLLGLEHHDDADKAYFTPNRTGLDHLAFGLNSRTELDEWVAHLDALGVDRDPIVDAPERSLALVAFRDPDGLELELIWHGH